jgi:hypothetical protein
MDSLKVNVVRHAYEDDFPQGHEFGCSGFEVICDCRQILETVDPEG